MSHFITWEPYEGNMVWFGPFPESEMDKRLNDAYADQLSEVGIVDSWEAAEVHPNVTHCTAEYWMTQLFESYTEEEQCKDLCRQEAFGTAPKGKHKQTCPIHKVETNG